MHPPFYVPGLHAAGTPEDTAAMQAAAIPCWLFKMRAFGMRLPPQSVQEPIQGNVLCIDRYGYPPTFYIRFYRQDKWAHHHLEMQGAVVVKERDGVWQFFGDEWIESKHRYRQTWLCTPTAERGREIIARMT